MSNIQKLRLDELNILAGTQSRVATNNDTVKEYKEALEEGASFPPVIVFSDGSESGKWLADGFHRYHAHRAANLVEIECEMRAGTLREAVLFSSGANGTHGLPRTNADKNNAVKMVLALNECEDWSDRHIARHCKVSHNFVGDVRRAICHPMTDAPPPVRIVQRGDATYELNTAKIGKPLAPVAPAAAAPPSAVSPTAVQAAAPAPAHDDPDAPDFGAPAIDAAAPAAPVTLADMDEHDDGVMFDAMELLIAEQEKVAQLEQDRNALKARVAQLEKGDLAAQIVKLEQDLHTVTGRADRYYDDFTKANNTAIRRKTRLDQIRQAAGLAPDADLVAWARQAARRAA